MSSENNKPVNMGLKLFPPSPKNAKNPSRKPSPRRHSTIPQSPPQSAVERPETPFSTDGPSGLDGRESALGGRLTPQNGRETPQTSQQLQAGRQTPQSSRITPQPGLQPTTGRQTPQSGRNTPEPSLQPASTLAGRHTPQQGPTSPSPLPITLPSPVHLGSEIPRSQTSFSEAPTLVRSHSTSSHNSTTKNGLNSPQRGEPVIRSIFPRYNPEIPLEYQPYYPQQTSPQHIPRTVISRMSYAPSISDRSPSGLQSPIASGVSPGRFPRDLQDESILETSTTDELKELWKVANGWRVSPSEGRKYCLKMSSNVEEPVHTLSSSTQVFCTLRLDPTSTSAQMTMTRQDPSKPIKDKDVSSPRLTMSSFTSKAANPTMEVLSTTLEEHVRRLPPNDGLVALLYPRAAADTAVDVANKPHRADTEQVIAAAERECGRLVWDEDSKKYYLVHPAISTPFVVAISSSPAWSRVEYTLEHAELPRNIVRLVRDGAGSGYLEVDTTAAAKIDCFYVVDVAICTIMLVAIEEEKANKVERFDAPPSIAPDSPKPQKGKGKDKGKKKGSKNKEKGIKMEEFEMDLEGQESLKDKMGKGKEKEEKVPGFCGLIWMMIKLFVWTIMTAFKALAKCIILVSKCLTREKS